MQQDFQAVGVNITKEIRDIHTELETKENLVFAGAGIHIDKINGKTVITAGDPSDGTLYEPVHLTLNEYQEMVNIGPAAFNEGRLYVVDATNGELTVIWRNVGENRVEVTDLDTLFLGDNVYIKVFSEPNRVAVQADLTALKNLLMGLINDLTSDLNTKNVFPKPSYLGSVSNVNKIIIQSDLTNQLNALEDSLQSDISSNNLLPDPTYVGTRTAANEVAKIADLTALENRVNNSLDDLEETIYTEVDDRIQDALDQIHQLPNNTVDINEPAPVYEITNNGTTLITMEPESLVMNVSTGVKSIKSVQLKTFDNTSLTLYPFILTVAAYYTRSTIPYSGSWLTIINSSNLDYVDPIYAPNGIALSNQPRYKGMHTLVTNKYNSFYFVPSTGDFWYNNPYNIYLGPSPTSNQQPRSVYGTFSSTWITSFVTNGVFSTDDPSRFSVTCLNGANILPIMTGDYQNGDGEGTPAPGNGDPALYLNFQVKFYMRVL